MYDDDMNNDDDDIALFSDGMELGGDSGAPEYFGPASGGYDAFRGGDGDGAADIEEWEEELRREELRREAQEQEFKKHGAEERQYYDTLAKEADQRRRKMEAEIRSERLALNDLLIKRGHLEREYQRIERELDDLRANELLLGKKTYRREGLLEEDKAIRDVINTGQVKDIPTQLLHGALKMMPLSSDEQREIAEASEAGELTQANITRSKDELERRQAQLSDELHTLSETIAERQRALSLKEHALRRIV